MNVAEYKQPYKMVPGKRKTEIMEDIQTSKKHQFVILDGFSYCRRLSCFCAACELNNPQECARIDYCGPVEIICQEPKPVLKKIWNDEMARQCAANSEVGDFIAYFNRESTRKYLVGRIAQVPSGCASSYRVDPFFPVDITENMWMDRGENIEHEITAESFIFPPKGKKLRLGSQKNLAMERGGMKLWKMKRDDHLGIITNLSASCINNSSSQQSK